MAKSKSAQYYSNNPEAREKKKAYDTKYHSTPARKKYRRELGKKNRELGSKVGDGLDYDHAVGRLVKNFINRGRNSKNKGGKGDKKARG